MSESRRTVRLFCPALSKVVQVVANEDQKLDLGSIARTFGLDPATLKLNGHFISRGVDLIASSVTWKSLISFFSSRGLSTGISESGALVVDGKLSKSGSKRPNESVNGIPSTSSINKRQLLEDSNLSKKTKSIDLDRGSGEHIIGNPFSLKRKQDDANSSLKRVKVDETGSQSKEQTSSSGILSKTRLPCSFLGVKMKRMRENDMILPAACKRIR